MSSHQSIVFQWLRARLPVSMEEQQRRAAFIEAYVFPDGLRQRFAAANPQLDEAQCAATWDGLKSYFHLCRLAGARFVAMPSEAADAAWHEFILWTREYDDFCQNAFGRFLHHTPAAGAGGAAMNDGYWRAWRLACDRERMDPARTLVLPALFALDAELGLTPSAPEPARAIAPISTGNGRGRCIHRIERMWRNSGLQKRWGLSPAIAQSIALGTWHTGPADTGHSSGHHHGDAGQASSHDMIAADTVGMIPVAPIRAVAILATAIQAVVAVATQAEVQAVMQVPAVAEAQVRVGAAAVVAAVVGEAVAVEAAVVVAAVKRCLSHDE